MAAVKTLSVVAGIVVVLIVVSDAVETLVVTQGRRAPWRPTRIWYAGTWRLARALGSRLPFESGEAILNVYPAVSLLGLLVLWLAGLVVGWAFLYWGIGLKVVGTTDFGTILYYSGTALLTPAFGTAHGPTQRTLTLLETLTGLGTIALMISYLPALYGAYSRRESRLLTLDDPLGMRITPARVIAVHCGDGDIDVLYRFFAEWEMWTAEVLESHVSYPMLALFRSQHRGQSWITALGVVTDAATLTCACVEGTEQREPYFMYRRGRRAVVEISDRLHVSSDASLEWLTKANFDIAWDMLQGVGLPLRQKDEAWERLQVLRNSYGNRLQELMDFLVAPRGFWGDSAEETVAQEVIRSTAEAHLRARQKRADGNLSAHKRSAGA
ncbi:MAG TPA: hypothetical protein VEJ87_08335 [Acidimicrobiales bacterium]|nr:hypothetical protein [Acidimicrobiales bacterium]